MILTDAKLHNPPPISPHDRQQSAFFIKNSPNARFDCKNAAAPGTNLPETPKHALSQGQKNARERPVSYRTLPGAKPANGRPFPYFIPGRSARLCPSRYSDPSTTQRKTLPDTERYLREGLRSKRSSTDRPSGHIAPEHKKARAIP